jgi:hypothetical protein
MFTSESASKEMFPFYVDIAQVSYVTDISVQVDLAWVFHTSSDT